MRTPSSPSSSYSRGWTRTWGAAATAGALLGLWTLGPGPAALTFVISFAAGAGLWVALGSEVVGDARGTWATAGSFAGAAVLGTEAIGQGVSGPLAFWLLVLAAASSPPVAAALARIGERASAGEPSGPVSPTSVLARHVEAGLTVERVRVMATDELCQRWRRSYLGLQAANHPDELAEVRRVRQLLLDELHRRHPAGVEAWLARGARAAGGPERYLHPPGPEGLA